MLKMDLEYNKGILFVRLEGILNRRSSYKLNNYLVPVILVIIDIVLSLILPTDSSSRLIQVINICVLGIVTVPIYLILNKKNLKEILPEKLLKLLKKIKLA